MTTDTKSFHDEMLRLLRALEDSLERENELQRQLRRTKETLVSVALRLQTAIKVAQEDELTIAALRGIAEDAKAKEIAATKRAGEAMEMIDALTLEVNRLKRKIRLTEAERQQQQPTGLLTVEQQQRMNDAADEEVDALLAQETLQPVPQDISQRVLRAATPFDRWKMNQFLFSPDTPAASLTHDPLAVERLAEAAAEHELLQESLFGRDTIFEHTGAYGASLPERPTVSAIAKRRKKLETAYTADPSVREKLQTLGANDYEVLNGQMGEMNFLSVAPTRPGTVDKEDRRFFLSNSPEQRWGEREKLSSSQKGRGTFSQTGNNNNFKSAMSSSVEVPKKHNNVKLKSLRIDETPHHKSDQMRNSTTRLQKLSV